MKARRVSATAIWFFDCDGVLLDSNGVKTDAFRATTLRYGSEVADAVVAHHLDNGGVSRFIKFERVFTHLLKREPVPGEYEELLRSFGEHSQEALTKVPTDPSARSLLSALATNGIDRQVVSGGLEAEVADGLVHHGLADLFTEIHGSPRTKREIIEEELRRTRTPAQSCVMVGDSKLDMSVAGELGMQRVFVHHWSEFEGWRGHVASNPDILAVEDLGELQDRLAQPKGSGEETADWLPSLA